jgi:hypothetical protein
MIDTRKFRKNIKNAKDKKNYNKTIKIKKYTGGSKTNVKKEESKKNEESEKNIESVQNEVHSTINYIKF